MSRIIFPLLLAASGCGLFQSLPPPPTPLQKLSAGGIKLLDRGLLEEAEATFSRALVEAELLDDLPSQAEAWINLGTVARLRGDLRGASTSHRRALRLAIQQKDQAGQARAYQHLGSDALEAEDLLSAEQSFLNARALSSASGDPTGEARALVALSTVALRRDRVAEALQLSTQARDLAGGDFAVEAAAFANRSLALAAEGDLTAAMEARDHALSLDRKRRDPRAIAGDLRALGLLAVRAGKPDLAAEYWLREAKVGMGLKDWKAAKEALGRVLQGGSGDAVLRDEAQSLAEALRSEDPGSIAR